MLPGVPVIPEWKRPERPSLVLRLWTGTGLAVYTAQAKPSGDGYRARRYTPDDDDTPDQDT